MCGGGAAGDSPPLPGANAAKNKRKRDADKLKAAAKKAAAAVDPTPPSPAPAAGNSKYCVNDFGFQLIATTAFPQGMPADAKCRPCAPKDGKACTRLHVVAVLQPGQLDKGIANDMIAGVSRFNNPVYKENFVRIVKWLKAN